MPVRERQKKLMILGAGPFQVPGIRKAVALGHYVISVDDRPHNIGHRFSHQYLNCSTTEWERLAQEAETLAIDGVCTFSSDVAMPSVGYICDWLSLPGVSFATARRMSTKHQFRDAQQQANLPHPGFLAGKSPDDLLPRIGALRFPVVVKPVDSSGSRGVRLIQQHSAPEFENAFSFAQHFSASGVVCVEEFVEGKEFGGDGILIEGEFAFVEITEKHLEGFVVIGHSLPAGLSHDDRRRIQAALEDCCRAVGYAEGPLNFDVKLTPERVVVLEMSARNGGNGIPAVIERATGVDVEGATIRLALGELHAPPQAGEKVRGAASFVFGSRTRGRLRKINEFAQVKTTVPELIELNVIVGPDDAVEPFEHNGNLIGYAVFDCEPASRFTEIAARIENAVDIRVEES
jgi:biotin carboxylase